MEAHMEKMTEKDYEFLLEANDILRDSWNRGLFDVCPVVKERVAKLLEVKDGVLV
jgi:hypothetical protein